MGAFPFRTARGWDFYESDEPQLFEETDRYRLPDRSQRLTEDMLRRYAAALEIPLGGAEVATGEGLLLTEQDWPLGGCVDHDAANQELADLRRDAHRRAAPS